MTALFVSMFALGLATSVHCISMCGPMVVTYAIKGEEDEHWTHKITPNLAYQLAKITSYVLTAWFWAASASRSAPPSRPSARGSCSPPASS